MLIKLYRHLLKLDGAMLKSDSYLTKLLKRKILKPIGYHFRKKWFYAKLESFKN